MRLKRLVIGQRLEPFPGKTWNNICEFVENGKTSNLPEFPDRQQGIAPPILVWNDWKDLDAGDIIGLGRPLADPNSSNPDQKDARFNPPILTGEAIDADRHLRSHGVFLQQTELGDTGWVSVYGIQWAKLWISDTSHSGVKLVDGEAFYSTQQSQGDIFLCWKPNLVGFQFGMVQLPASSSTPAAGRIVRGTLVGDINPGGIQKINNLSWAVPPNTQELWVALDSGVATKVIPAGFVVYAYDVGEPVIAQARHTIIVSKCPPDPNTNLIRQIVSGRS